MNPIDLMRRWDNKYKTTSQDAYEFDQNFSLLFHNTQINERVCVQLAERF